MKKKLDDLAYSHGDFDRVLRGAQADLKDRLRTEARKAEVDGRAPEVPLDVPVLLVEDAHGIWTAETTSQVYPSQRGAIKVRDRDERMALCDLRQALKDAMVEDRHCGSWEAAHKLAAKANVWVCGRVPFIRIVSK